MPPTNFFGRSSTDDDVAEDDRDAESILEECLAAGVPQHTLDWHYRSQHESLIAFSNSRYYDNRLITFPAPVTRASAVSWRRVAGLYAKGNGRTNQVEAEALVAEAVARLTSPDLDKKTLGIIVLNAEQQHLVEDLLDRARQTNPALEHFFGDAVLEQMFVKNLETVQGDERDIILIGIGYGPTEPGAPVMSMNFGPLNRDGGWRRLNVALTRARAEMVLFTSFDSSMIDLSRTSARAVRDLKHFIEFAERGPRALVEAVQGSLGGFDSPFESAVAEALTRKGWQVVTQIGVSRFRIDLGVVHPDRPGDYLVGVECDGAAYHSAATARDRDKVRQAILETLGWKLLRVWSTDWWVDKAGAAEKLHLAISRLLEADRALHAVRDNVVPESEMPDSEAGDLTMEDAD
jgi:very-short-patch-repair endonuclease